MGHQGLTQILRVAQNAKGSRCNGLRVIGGLPIFCGRQEGTAAIVIDMNGVYLLTAGHVAGEPGTQVECQGRVIGSVENNFFPDGVDIAMIKINHGINYGLNEVKVGNEIYKNVKRAATMPGKFKVVMAGTEFAKEGQILQEDVDVKVGQGQQMVSHVSLATYPSEESDSGAAVLTENPPILWGIHGGRILYNNARLPQNAGTGLNVAFFTPMDNIE